MRCYQLGKIVLAVLALTTVAAGSASAAACTNASLMGIYGVVETGFVAANTPGAGLFQINADGSGNVTGTGTESANGTIVPVTLTGTYAVARNCTGTATVKNQANVTSHFAFVFDNVRKGFQIIATDDGQVLSGYGIAEGAAVCGLTGKKAIFAASLAGLLVGIGPVAIVATTTLDGNGNISGSGTLDENGDADTLKVTGTYTAKSDCTGTATVKAGGAASNFATVVVNGGKELLAIETDAQSVVTGNLQQ